MEFTSLPGDCITNNSGSGNSIGIVVGYDPHNVVLFDVLAQYFASFFGLI